MLSSRILFDRPRKCGAEWVDNNRAALGKIAAGAPQPIQCDCTVRLERDAHCIPNRRASIQRAGRDKMRGGLRAIHFWDSRKRNRAWDSWREFDRFRGGNANQRVRPSKLEYRGKGAAGAL